MISSIVFTVIAQNKGGKMSDQELIKLFDQAEEIGMIGSPSSTTELALDILGQSVNKNLVGELAMFRFMQDNTFHYALGQINEITLRNRWLEEAAMRSIVRERSRLEGISERQDTHQGEMIVSAVFSDNNGEYGQSRIGTVPATGTPIRLVDNTVLDEILKKYKNFIFYLGQVYGSTPKLPLWFKHFGDGPDGAGEAYHLGIFGKTGSGKSVLAKMILLAYARHPQMGLFILDPQGEFAIGLSDESTQITSMGQILSANSLNALGRQFEIFNLSRFYLDSFELFGELLVEFGFFNELSIRYANYQANAAEYVVGFLRNSEHKLGTLGEEAFIDTLDYLDENVNRLYTGREGQSRVQNFISEARQRQVSPAKEIWNRTVKFFSKENGKVSISEIIDMALETPQDGSRPLVVVDLSERPADIPDSTWNENIKPLLIDRFLSNLIRRAENAFQNNLSLNTLVILDEAQRLAPRGRIESDRKERIKVRLIDAAKTTRKYGLGWMFISQTLSSLDRDIIDSGLRVFFFGFGLGVGAEFQSLRELVGGRGKALELYQRFLDPQSAFDSAFREYSFMTIGPVSPLSFSGTPLFLSAFTKPDEFLSANQIQI